MFFKTRWLVTLVALTMLSFSNAKVQAQPIEQSSSDVSGTESVTTEQLLQKMCALLKAQKSFALEMDVTYDNVLDSGAKV